MTYNFAAILDHNRDRYPDVEALVHGDLRLTHRQLHERVDTVAAAFPDIGIGRGDIVGLLAYNRVEFLEIVLATCKIGAIVLPLNYRLAAAEWHYILQHAGAKAVIAESELVAQVDSCVQDLGLLAIAIDPDPDPEPAGPVRWLGWADFVARGAGRTAELAVIEADTVQRLMYTSGTTSRPKGVPLTHVNIAWKNLSQIVEFDLNRQTRLLVCGPLYHIAGLDLPGLAVLHAGGTLVLLRKFDAREVLRLIVAERITGIWLAPAMLNAVLAAHQDARSDTSTVRFIVGGGEKTPIPVIEALRLSFPEVWFADAYGLTETASGDTFLDHAHVVSKLGSVGRPALHVEVTILDEAGDTVSAGELGEIAVRGPKVFSGYWRDQAATERAFHNGWFRTGDVGRLDADDYLYVEDRKKDMIISGGENIASPEVERVLYEHPAVLEAAVIGLPHERWGEVPQAFVVFRPGQRADSDEIVEFCRQRLAKFKVPVRVQEIAALPRTASGKVLKRELRDRPD